MSRTTTIPLPLRPERSTSRWWQPQRGQVQPVQPPHRTQSKGGNYPGVTVDKKVGRCVLGTRSLASVVDLPGTYSVFPRSSDEQVVLDHLLGNPPDAVVAVIDMTNLERGLLLATQLIDLALPVVLVLNMADVAQRQGMEVNTVALGQRLGGVPVVMMNARRGEGLDDLKAVLRHQVTPARQRFFDARPLAPDAIDTVRHTSTMPKITPLTCCCNRVTACGSCRPTSSSNSLAFAASTRSTRRSCRFGKPPSATASSANCCMTRSRFPRRRASRSPTASIAW